MRFAEVLLPLPFANTFTYRIPESMLQLLGLYCRVVAPFGNKHFYTGVVIEIHDRCPDQHIEIKDIFELMDEKPVINTSQLLFWQWLSGYYLCKLGEVCRAALPTGLKIESETFIRINPDFESDKPFKPNEQRLLDALPFSSALSVAELEKKIGIRNAFPVINSLLTVGSVLINETLKTGFKPKTETFLRLADHIRTESDLQHVLERLKRSGQQEKLFINFLEICGTDTRKTVSKRTLLKHSGINASILIRLIKSGILVSEEKAVSRIDLSDMSMEEATALSEEQEQVYEELKKSFTDNEITLLHGDLSGGQTKIYIRLIQDAMTKGLQTLFLLPEISLTIQITEQLKKIFGSKLLVYHSGISDNERVEIWNHILQSDEPFVVLGTRSSLFLPFGRLGLVIVDEEHDASYKQQDPAPRYHARNAAMMLAHQYGAKTLLGSVTPSLESYLWATKGKYGYVKTDNKYAGKTKPRVEIVNVSDLRRKKLMRDTLFSPLLKAKIDEALSKGEQVVIFQNRRGFAPFVACKSCGMIPHCVNCDVSLAYHKQKHRLTCHYCGYNVPYPIRCTSCGSDDIKTQGFGTEKIEEEVAALFHLAKVARLDFDTARTESVFRRILNDFEDQKIQLIIGTRMVSKGLYYANVSVVGILNADALMNIPDFRAYERAYQLMYQISGYADGHDDRQGWVVIQTSQAENELLQMVRQFDYQDMARKQLKERHQFRYPPYTRLIMLVLRGKNEQILDEIAELYAQRLRAKLGSGVSDPVYPPVTRVHTLYIRKIMLKIDLSRTVSDTRKILEEVHSTMQQAPGFKQLIMHYDVDPQ